MPLRFKRRIALFLIALFALGPVSAALASCPMGMSGEMMSMMAMDADHPCEGCDTSLNDSRDLAPSVCATHCATQDQPAAFSAAAPLPAVAQPVLLLRVSFEAGPAGFGNPPSGAPPRRILLHSFQI